ncbi:MAG: hypothetical protein ABIQ95_13135 [Bdellovibrionia bacterium]
MRKHLVLAGLATLVFIALTWGMHFPLMADDYIFALKAYDPSFSLGAFETLLVKRPLASLVNFTLLKFDLFNSQMLGFYLFFFLHSLGLLGIIKWMSDRLNPASLQGPVKSAGIKIGFEPFLIMLCLYPCLHEVLYMRLSAPYSLGIVFLALMLYSTSIWSRVLWMFCAFSLFETFVIPALLLPFVPDLFDFLVRRQVPNVRKVFQHSVAWVMALGCYFILRYALSIYVPSTSYQLDFSLFHLFSQVKQNLSLLWTIHFFKEYWVLSLLEWLVILTSLFYFPGENRRKWVFALMLLVVPFVASAQALLINYYAPRAVYGGVILKIVLLGCVFKGFASRADREFCKVAVLALLCCVYVNQSMRVFAIKSSNFEVLATKEAAWIEKMQNCAEPCSLVMGNLAQDLHQDWVLPPFVYQSYLKWVQLRHGITKQIEFKLN